MAVPILLLACVASTAIMRFDRWCYDVFCWWESNSRWLSVAPSRSLAHSVSAACWLCSLWFSIVDIVEMYNKRWMMYCVCWIVSGAFRVLHSKICLGHWRRPRNFTSTYSTKSYTFLASENTFKRARKYAPTHRYTTITVDTHIRKQKGGRARERETPVVMLFVKPEGGQFVHVWAGQTGVC